MLPIAPGRGNVRQRLELAGLLRARPTTRIMKKRGSSGDIGSMPVSRRRTVRSPRFLAAGWPCLEIVTTSPDFCTRGKSAPISNGITPLDRPRQPPCRSPRLQGSAPGAVGGNYRTELPLAKMPPKVDHHPHYRPAEAIVSSERSSLIHPQDERTPRMCTGLAVLLAIVNCALAVCLVPWCPEISHRGRREHARRDVRPAPQPTRTDNQRAIVARRGCIGMA